MPIADDEIERIVVRLLKEISGRRTIDLDNLIGQEVGIYGGDTALLLERLEHEFEIDLEPLLDQYAIILKPSWIDKLMGKHTGLRIYDFTVRTLVKFIRESRRQHT